jgi:hypothetical protein
MLGYCRLTSLAWRKELNNDSQAHYLPSHSIRSAGADLEEAEAGFPCGNANGKPDATGNASDIIETG